MLGTISDQPGRLPARFESGQPLWSISYIRLFEITEPDYRVFGGNSERVTPVPIPNTEVKPLSADGTARATVWESRSLPNFFLMPLSFTG